MNTYLIPTDDATIESVAKSIALNRLQHDAFESLQEMVGKKLTSSDSLENVIDILFEQLWNGNTEHDMRQKERYRGDAIAAIRAINLKLITTA
jgi:hypothetical protein